MIPLDLSLYTLIREEYGFGPALDTCDFVHSWTTHIAVSIWPIVGFLQRESAKRMAIVEPVNYRVYYEFFIHLDSP